MLGGVDDMSAVEDFRPYQGRWQLAEMRRYFARPQVPLSVSLLAERTDEILRWREVRFAAGAGVEGIATVVLPMSTTVTRGVVLAHGGSDDGREFFMSEAAALAAEGAAVIMPVTRIRQDAGVDAFATAVRTAVLTERAALQVLIEAGAPPGELSFLGHSAGGALGAILSAVEPRLARIAIFGNGAGPLARSALARALSHGSVVTPELAAVTDWFDLAHFVGVERRAQLLLQHGRADQIVPLQAARALFDAAAEPKLWAEYDCDHGLDADPQARKDRAEFIMNSPFPMSNRSAGGRPEM
jgi:predicted esterase